MFELLEGLRASTVLIVDRMLFSFLPPEIYRISLKLVLVAYFKKGIFDMNP